MIALRFGRHLSMITERWHVMAGDPPIGPPMPSGTRQPRRGDRKTARWKATRFCSPKLLLAKVNRGLDDFGGAMARGVLSSTASESVSA